VAIDDVGAGYASMAHVLQLSPDIIKLDRAFTAAIDTDQRRRSLVSTMRAFAEQTDAALLAEGIETLAELETMTSLGVTLGQGYLLGRPMPLTEQALDRAYLP
jgi:EAL domain-containing protein (putative c-di-GMP-specific phosphodiesterase class I)